MVSELLSPPQVSVLTFTLTPLQYVAVYHNKLPAGMCTCLPLSCEVPDSPRWNAGTKPKPRPGKVITVSSFVVRIIQTDTGAIDKLVVNMDQVIYLADATPPSTALENTLGDAYFMISMYM